MSEADANAEVRIPRSALGSVQRALASVHAAVGLPATLQAIAEGVTSSTPYTNVTVTTAREPDAADLHVEAVVGPPDAVAMLLGTTCPRAAMVEHLAGGEAWGALRFWPHFGETDGVIMFVPDYEPLDVPDAWRPEYELMAPLYGPDGELIGTMSLDRPRDGRIPPPWANEFLELFAEQAVIAILNARRHEQALRAMRSLEQERADLHAAVAEHRARATDLRHQTRRDSLTGLANRVLLQERLEELLAGQIPLAVVFCDLDGFKQINDTHGHAVGDEVLRVIGARLTRRLAAADVVARIGGDEFVVVAAGVQQHDAPELLRRIDEAFTRDPVRIGDVRLEVSCSLGLVCEPGGAGARPGTAAERAEELLSNADREMYAHKRSRAGVQRLLQLAGSQPRSPRPDAGSADAAAGMLDRCPGSADLMREPVADLGDICLDEPNGSVSQRAPAGGGQPRTGGQCLPCGTHELISRPVGGALILFRFNNAHRTAASGPDYFDVCLDGGRTRCRWRRSGTLCCPVATPMLESKVRQYTTWPRSAAAVEAGKRRPR